MKKLAHRSEHTGSAQGERAQGNVRDAISFAVRENVASRYFFGIGIRRVRMADKDYRLTARDLEAAVLIFDGPLTAARQVTLPEVPDTAPFQRLLKNNTGQDLTFVNTDGSMPLPAATVTALMVVTADGPEAYT